MKPLVHSVASPSCGLDDRPGIAWERVKRLQNWALISVGAGKDGDIEVSIDRHHHHVDSDLNVDPLLFDAFVRPVARISKRTSDDASTSVLPGVALTHMRSMSLRLATRVRSPSVYADFVASALAGSPQWLLGRQQSPKLDWPDLAVAWCIWRRMECATRVIEDVHIVDEDHYAQGWLGDERTLSSERSTRFDL